MPTSKDEVIKWLEEIANSSINLAVDNEELALTAIDMIEEMVDIEDDSLEQISPHFTLSELTYSATAEACEIDNSPTDPAISELDSLANKTLEKIRTICNGKPVMISSGYRCPELNKQIGGASNSAHLYGAAADLTIPNYGSPLDVCMAILPHMLELEIDQLIYETNSSGGCWVHVGRRTDGGTPRNQAFSIIKGVTQDTPFPGY